MNKSAIIFCLFFISILIFGVAKAHAYSDCNSVTCSGGEYNGQSVTNWCQYIGTDPGGSNLDCDPNPPSGYQQCYWNPHACDSEDCRDYEPGYCDGKVSCPIGTPNSCIFADCNQGTGQCYASCDTNAYCAPPPVPTNTPVPPPPGQTCSDYCDQQHTCNGGANWIYARACTNNATGELTYSNQSNCDPTQCSTGNPQPCQAGQTACSSNNQCGGGSCTNGVCQSCSGGNPEPASFNCNNFVASNVNSITTYRHGVTNTSSFGINSTLNINVEDTVRFGANTPGIGPMSTGTPFVRTQFRLFEPPSTTPLAECLKASNESGGSSNFCIDFVSMIAFNRSGDFGGVGELIATKPTYDQRHDFWYYGSNWGGEKRYKGTCSLGTIWCCTRTGPFYDANGEYYMCQDGDDACHQNDSEGERSFTPEACKYDDNGNRQTPLTHGIQREARKKFTTPGTYVVTAFEQRVGGTNENNACKIQVVVGGTPAANVTGSFDKAFCSTTYLQGWAYNSIDPSTPVTITLKEGATTLGTATANQAAGSPTYGSTRQDIINANVCPSSAGGNGNCIWSFNTAGIPSLNDGNAHNISAWYDAGGGNLQQLPASPLAYNPAQANVIANRNDHCANGRIVLGTLYNDYDGNASVDSSNVAPIYTDDFYQGANASATMTLYDASGTLVETVQYTGNGGQYFFGSHPYGVYYVKASNFPPNRFISVTSPGQDGNLAQVTVSPASPSYGAQVTDIFVSQYYQVRGTVFKDNNKDNVWQNPPEETAYERGGSVRITVGGTRTIPVAIPGGTYTLDQLKPNVEYGFKYDFPADPGGFTYQNDRRSGVYVGVGLQHNCASFSPLYGASCEAVTSTIVGDIKNLNFAVTNSIPWVQFQGLDVRQESGFTHKVPETVSPFCSDVNLGSGNSTGVGSVGKYNP